MTERSTAIGHVPVINVAPLMTGMGDRSRVADEIRDACRYSGFFYIVGHGVEERLQRRLEDSDRLFGRQVV